MAATWSSTLRSSSSSRPPNRLRYPSAVIRTGVRVLGDQPVDVRDPVPVAQMLRAVVVHDGGQEELRGVERVERGELCGEVPVIVDSSWLASIFLDGPPTESVDRFGFWAGSQAGQGPECRVGWAPGSTARAVMLMLAGTGKLLVSLG
ncbi:hypothetical protein CG723_36640 [Streptomyces sp. CB01635]|nr:hypothetical protein CG723_36640 [Streptomyces sp. CB01635]